MAQRQRKVGRFWSRLHFLIRFLGLSGLLVACVGLVLLQMLGKLASWQTVQDALLAPDAAAWLVIGGTAAAVPALLVELIVGMTAASARRSVFGLNAIVQVALAAALLVGINVYAFLHPMRFDWTRKQEFTIPAAVQTELRGLNDETTVVIYQRHKTAADADKPDRYDFAAERKVVEKVKDLVQQLREIGPRFRVSTLDVEEENYDDNLKNLTKDAPELRQAIEAAPENTLFFCSNGHVQSMSFNEFGRLKRVESREADGDRGNLVLAYPGVGPVADRIVKLEEHRPRVGVLVPHEALTTNGSVDLFTLSGLKKTLNAHGFDVRDVVLKRWPAGSPAADLPEDSRMDRLVREQDTLDGVVEDEAALLARLEKRVKDWPRGHADELEELEAALASHREIARQVRRQHDDVKKELEGMDQDAVAERRRNTDLGAKLQRDLADCDLLLVPRLTIMANGEPISDRETEFYGLTADQATAVKDFLRQGKPIFACLGPRNERSSDDPTATGEPPPLDELEKMLGDLGLHFSKKAVLFEGQVKIQADAEESLLVLSTEHQAPPLQPGRGQELEDALKSIAAFGAAGESPWPALGAAALPASRPQPVAVSLALRAHATGRPFDLALSYPRAIYLDDGPRQASPFDTALLSTGPDSWNDLQPFPSPRRPIPTYVPAGRKDPDNGTPEEKRRGPFTVGVAFETTVPAAWQTSAADKSTRLKVAAIGHGGVFIGKDLSPSQEALLLDTCNWLLDRDRLARPAPEWRYPRVAMSEYDQTLWLWAARLGLPLLFAYLGAVVLLVRRLR